MIPSTDAIQKTLSESSKRSYKKYVLLALVIPLVIGTIYYKFYNKKFNNEILLILQSAFLIIYIAHECF